MRHPAFLEQRCPSDRDCPPKGTDPAEAGLGVLRAMQPRRRAHLLRQQRPPGDGPAHARAFVLSPIPGNRRRNSIAADSSPPLKIADCGSISLVDDQHSRTLAMQTPPGKQASTVCRLILWRNGHLLAGGTIPIAQSAFGPPWNDRARPAHRNTGAALELHSGTGTGQQSHQLHPPTEAM